MPEAVLSEVTARKETGDRDMRRKRPPLLSSCCACPRRDVWRA